MTRSWNAGLALARALDYKYTCLANSDLLFSPGWDSYLRDACDTHILAGPVSNAAGHTSKYQDVARYLPDYKLSDKWDDLADVATKLRYSHHSKVNARVNGFCMMTRTELAWEHAFDAENVLDPSCPMAGNEDRLQDRWTKRGQSFAVVPASYVFHYRSVTRGNKYKRGRWMRMGEQPKKGKEL
jgi:GT2 family glycosyltransferase